MPTQESSHSQATHTRHASRRRLVAVTVGAAALAAASLLAGCGAGQVAETADIVPAVPGANLDITVPGGMISVRDATIDYPGPDGYRSGQDAPLTMRIINDSTGPVTLTGVTVTNAAGTAAPGKVMQFGGLPSPMPSQSATATPGARTPRAQASAGRSRAATATPSTNATGTASASATPTPTGPVGDAAINVTIPSAPDGLIVLSKANHGGTYLAIGGLTQDLTSQDQIQLILTFTLADGSSAQLGGGKSPGQRLLVPVAPPANALPRSPLSVSPTGG